MKKYLLILLSLILLLGTAGCGKNNNLKVDDISEKTDSKSEVKVIKVGATPVPHTEILEQAKEILKEKGYELQIVEFTDYVIPNTALAEGEIDANFFQHIPYLNKMNEEKELNLDYTVKVHLEPMGLYSSKIKTFDEIKENAEIGVPNDPTNGARALRLLEDNGLIKLNEGELITKYDIIENPKNIKIVELDAPQLPRSLDDFQAAVINTNYVLEADLNPIKDAIVIESKDSPYANILAVRKNNKDDAAIKALSEALTSDTIKKFIEEKYNGSIIPAF